MRSDWLRPEDVRRPNSAQEAINAIEIAERSIERLRGIIERKEAEPNGEKAVIGLKALVVSWVGKRAEMAYFVERMAAREDFETAEVMALKEALAKKDEDVRRLKHEKYLLERRSISADGQADDLRRENQELREKNLVLIDKNQDLRHQLSDTPPNPERPARMRRLHHDLAAFVAEVFDEMEAEGAVLPAMAQLLRDEANKSLPLNYRKSWKLAEYPLKRALVEFKEGEGGGGGE